jgi:enterochelin esterase-like enzyme
VGGGGVNFDRRRGFMGVDRTSESEYGLADIPRDTAIAHLLENKPPSGEAIDAFIEEQEFPVVDGRFCTFAFRGAADDVRLHHWIYGLETSRPFVRVPATDLWVHVMELPAGSRVEYKLEVRNDQDRHLIQDPLNHKHAHDPFGTNSVCHGEGYVRPEWTLTDEGAPAGSVEERVFHSDALGARRKLSIYKPAFFKETRRYPLLIVHDGGDYLRFAALRTVLDNLIHRFEIPDVIAVFMHPEDRMEQYRDSEAHARFIAEELVPQLESELPLQGTPAGRCLMGASLGAVASLSTAVRYPGMFGRLLLQSGSFAFSDIGTQKRGPIFDSIADFVNAYRDDPTPVSRQVFLTCGQYESLIYENRSLVPVLQSTGMSVRYVESRDGHNWENWRDRLREGLSWLFPGPLWLVYP